MLTIKVDNFFLNFSHLLHALPISQAFYLKDYDEQFRAEKSAWNILKAFQF